MPCRPDFVVVYVVRPRGEAGHEVLQLLRRPEAYLGNTWQFSGGRLHEDETAPAAAIRELREETGLFPERLTFLTFTPTFYVPSTDRIAHVAAFCALVKSDARPMLNAEHTAVRWIGRREIRRCVLWPTDRQALAELFREHLRPSLSLPHRMLDPANLSGSPRPS
jgi:8-oxo-dGTP pyrophosphatase MutT (NUDIX family)